MRPETIGWIVGFFVVLDPMHMAVDYSLVGGLIHGIIGVGVAIFLERRRI